MAGMPHFPHVFLTRDKTLTNTFLSYLLKAKQVFPLSAMFVRLSLSSLSIQSINVVHDDEAMLERLQSDICSITVLRFYGLIYHVIPTPRSDNVVAMTEALMSPAQSLSCFPPFFSSLLL
jgi:hypothetical protein